MGVKECIRQSALLLVGIVLLILLPRQAQGMIDGKRFGAAYWLTNERLLPTRRDNPSETYCDVVRIAMSATIEIENHGAVDYEWAINEDANVIQQLSYIPARHQLYHRLWTKREEICSLTRHHLGLYHDDTCNVTPSSEWIRGSFNVCIPIDVTSNSLPKKYILRCCLPHKLAEARYPGTVDEKLRCEVGAYIWIQESCTDIRIPQLYGFGFSDNTHFTREEYRPWYIRFARAVQRYLCTILRLQAPSRYAANPTTHRLPTAYMLLEHIGPDIGQMLSNTWDARRDDLQRRERLFRGLARVILSLARVPQPRIGSLQFNNDGSVTLTNRPLTCELVMLENEGIPRTMRTADIYPSTELFVADTLAFYDKCLLNHPNAVFDGEDCQEKMAVRMLLRALSHHYIKRRNGPFILQFTDLHASNIFVDDEWNIVCLVDLEWVCALPAEMLAVPYWLTGRGVDQLEGEALEEFDVIRLEFMRFFKEEEQALVTHTQHGLLLARIMDETWTSKGVWFWHCISSPDAMVSIARAHIIPLFSARLVSVAEMLSKFWCVDSHRVVERKVADYQAYEEDLRHCFSREQD